MASALLPIKLPAVVCRGLFSYLTKGQGLGHSRFPKSTEGIALAFARPKLAQKAVFFYSATNTLQASLVSVVIHWRDNVLVFVRTRQPSVGWGALFRLFLCSIPKFTEVIMSSLPSPTGLISCRVLLNGQRVLLCLPRSVFFIALRQLLPALRSKGVA
ncbi:MAG: hypothetical protein PHN64_08755 [Desulfovibrionaceae bacterium]|nr:hypothetical protein [Desulfovibrionaceae bacterium]